MVQRDFVRERQVQSCYSLGDYVGFVSPVFGAVQMQRQVQPRVVFCKYCSSIVPDALRCDYCGANDRWKQL